MSKHGYNHARYWLVALFALLATLAAIGKNIENTPQLLVSVFITVYFLANCLYSYKKGQLSYQRLLEISLISLIGEVILLSLTT